MNTATLFKSLSLVALTSLSLMAGTSQAGEGGYYRATVPTYGPLHHVDRHHHGHFPSHSINASIDERQRNQMERIRDGLQSGQLSRFEARQLLQEQKQIERAQRRYLADGRLSRDEWLALDRLQDQAGRNIREEKHDRDWR